MLKRHSVCTWAALMIMCVTLGAIRPSGRERSGIARARRVEPR